MSKASLRSSVQGTFADQSLLKGYSGERLHLASSYPASSLFCLLGNYSASSRQPASPSLQAYQIIPKLNMKFTISALAAIVAVASAYVYSRGLLNLPTNISPVNTTRLPRLQSSPSSPAAPPASPRMLWSHAPTSPSHHARLERTPPSQPSSACLVVPEE